MYKSKDNSESSELAERFKELEPFEFWQQNEWNQFPEIIPNCKMHSFNFEKRKHKIENIKYL